MEMDYKEKYEKALERARKLNADNMLSDEATEEIFPELKGNEDERIRLFICDLITRIFWGITWDFSKKDCLAYLEKQKEPRDYRKLYKGVSQSEWFKENYEGKSLGEEQKPADGKELLYVSSKSYNIGFRDGKMAAESKQEWSVEDERRRDGIIQWLREYQAKFNPKYDSLSIESIESLIDWFKSLRPQPKPEWSEEDERMRSRCIRSVECSKQFADSETYKEAKDKEIAWLKNLPERFNLQPKNEWNEDDEKKLELVTDFVFEFYPDPVMKYKLKAWLKSLRPSWKPSEEQMDALKSKLPIIKGTGNNVDSILESLYNDLKKLI